MMIVPIPGDDAPTEIVVRRKLEIAYPDLRQIPLDEWQEDVPANVSWMLALKLPGLPSPVYIWPEELDDLPEEAWWSSTDILDEERDRYDECSFGLIIETTFNQDNPRDQWRLELELALTLGRTAPFIYDDNAMHAVSKAVAESIVEIPAAPSAHEMISMHAVYDEDDADRLWLHTHGLARTGIPDIEAVDVWAIHRTTATQVIALIADRLLDGEIEVGDTLTIAPGLKIELANLDVAMAAIHPDAIGAQRDRDDDHLSERVVLALPPPAENGAFSFLPTRRPGFRLDGFLAELERVDLVYYTETDTARMAHQARYRWPLFLALWRQQDPEAWTFMVKTAFTTTQTAAGSEHLWFEVLSLGSDGIQAKLINEPFAVPSMTKGDVIVFSANEISDWSIATSDGVYDPRNAARLAAQNGIRVATPKPIH